MVTRQDALLPSARQRPTRVFRPRAHAAETSRFGPAVAFGNGKVFPAWVGTDPTALSMWRSPRTVARLFPKRSLSVIAANRLPCWRFILYLRWAGSC
jgi:hypothetical protein